MSGRKPSCPFIALLFLMTGDAGAQTAFTDGGAVQGLGYVQLHCELNGDGLPDFLGCICGTLFAPTYLSNGPLNYVTGPMPPAFQSRIATGDLNGDGFEDVAGTLGGILVSLLGSGGGAFTGPVVSPLFVANAWADRTVDLDGDGRSDLLALLAPGTGPAPPAIGRGTGNGTFTLWPLPASLPAPSAPLRAADVNGDGLLDILVGNGPRFLLQTPGGWIAGPLIPMPGAASTGALLSTIEIGDVNGDGSLDVVYPHAPAGALTGVAVTFGPSWGATMSYPAAPATLLAGSTPVLHSVADLDLDGIDDVICAQWGTAPPSHPVPVIRYGSPSGPGPEVRVVLPTVPTYTQIFRSPLDLDADGDLDLGLAPPAPAGTAFHAVLNLATGNHPGTWGVFASGCPSQLYPPSPALGITGNPATGQAFALTLSAVPFGAQGWLGISWRPASTILPNGCPLALDLGGPAPFPVVVPHGFGGGVSSSYPATLPAWPGLAGLRLWLQDLVIAPGYSGGYATSNGIMVVIG